MPVAPWHGARQPPGQTARPPAKRPGTGLLQRPGNHTTELEKASRAQGPVHLAMPPARHCPRSISGCQDFSLLSWSAAHEAETGGHGGISALVLSESSVREGSRGIACGPSTSMLLAAGRAGCRQAGSRGQGEGQERPGTNLSKISCSACWGQGEKASSQLKSHR